MEDEINRYYVTTTLGGGLRGYGVADVLSHSPWPKRFNLTLKEAEKEVTMFNKRGWELSFWDIICGVTNKDVIEAKEALIYENKMGK
jgi:hypothetical protein